MDRDNLQFPQHSTSRWKHLTFFNKSEMNFISVWLLDFTNRTFIRSRSQVLTQQQEAGSQQQFLKFQMI